MFSRRVISAIFPEGQAWEPAVDSDYDLLLNGIGANSDAVKDDLDLLRHIRNPWKTPVLSDLEREFAVIPSATATDAERRERLATKMFQRSSLPTYEFLESKLQSAGFNVQVHANSPAVDPAIFLDESFQMTAGDTIPGGNDAQCGEAEAYCGRIGGELLVNGDIFNAFPNYTVECDEPDALCGETESVAGNYDSIRLESVEYDIPPSDYWPLIFFVGGDATRNALGELTNIDIAPIAVERQREFKNIILRHKPMFSWAALIVVYS